MIEDSFTRSMSELFSSIDKGELFFSGSRLLSNNDSLSYYEGLGDRDDRRYLSFPDDVLRYWKLAYDNSEGLILVFARNDLISNESYLKYDDKSTPFVLVLGNFMLYQFYYYYKQGYVEFFNETLSYIYFNPISESFECDTERKLLSLKVQDIFTESLENSLNRLREDLESVSTVIEYDENILAENLLKVKQLFDKEVTVYELDANTSYEEYLEDLDYLDNESIQRHENNIYNLMNYKLSTDYQKVVNDFQTKCFINNIPQASFRGLLLSLIISSYHLDDIKYLYSIFTNRNYGDKVFSRIKDTMVYEHGNHYADECLYKINSSVHMVFNEYHWKNFIESINDTPINDEITLYINYGIYQLLISESFHLNKEDEIKEFIKEWNKFTQQTLRYKYNPLQNDLDRLYKNYKDNLEDDYGTLSINDANKYYTDQIETLKKIMEE